MDGRAAGLVRADLTPKPAYERLMKLIKDKWWARADLTSDGMEKPISADFWGGTE